MFGRILRWRVPIAIARAPWLNCLTLIWLAFLLFALIHGPGRGMSLAPGGHELSPYLGVANVVAYLGFFVGSLDMVNRGGIAIGALSVGLLARGFYEIHTSFLKRLWLDQFPVNEFVIVFAIGSYLLTFILPALLLIDRWRFEKNRPRSEESKDWLV